MSKAVEATPKARDRGAEGWGLRLVVASPAAVGSREGRTCPSPVKLLAF